MQLRKTLCVLLLAVAIGSAPGQPRAVFDVKLLLDYRSAEQTVALYQGRYGQPGEIAALRGSQIALSTTALLAQQLLDTPTLEANLRSAKFNQDLGDDIFRMGEARGNVHAIKELLDELQLRNFGERVIRTVEQLFPSDAQVQSRIPVYIVAFGHRNIDAYVRRVVWKGNVPVFVGEGEGESTIVVNLAKAVYYGQSLEERFIGLLSVVAHEVFHAAFGAYKDRSSVWQRYYRTHRRHIDQLMDISQNEGIAYYLSLIQQTRGNLLPGWEENVRSSFATFNKYADELLSAGTSSARAQDIIRESNTSGYWESYGAMTGMIIARQIDQSLGRAALVETIASGPVAFFGKYVDLMERDGRVPHLSPLLVKEIRLLRR